MACMVVQAVVKVSNQSDENGQILTPCGSEAPEQISMILELSNYRMSQL